MENESQDQQRRQRRRRPRPPAEKKNPEQAIAKVAETTKPSSGKKDRKGKSQEQRGGGSPKGPRGKLRIIPLGGVGEVGKNVTVVEYESDLILLDCGAKFPEGNQLAIDLVVPDVTYVRERLNNLRGIVVTHGHEDHIGGLPFMLMQLQPKSPIKVYGSPLAMGLLESKILEHRMDKLVELRSMEPGQRISLGKLTAEFVHVTHSIPDTNAIAVTSPVGTIIDTADFKFDPTPVMGKPTNERRLRRLGDVGVLALMSDTVRVENAGTTASERVVRDTMQRVVGEARGQVLVATFASNISRLQMALEAAAKHNRVVAVAGRSLEQSSRVAIELGYLDPPEGLLVSLDEALKLPPRRRLLMVTGSQGEPAAALSRIALNEHPKIRITRNDVVLVSATPVPGNEEIVTQTIDNLFRRGATVVYSGVERGVHVSGHASRDELKKMIELVRPKYVIPIHGEFRHMALYRELAVSTGIPEDHVLLPEIGGVIEFTANTGGHHGRVPAGTVLVDRLGDRGSSQALLREPDKLADEGLVIVTIVMRSDTNQTLIGPEISGKFLNAELTSQALKEAQSELKNALQRQAKRGLETGFMARKTKEVVSRSLYRRSKSKPLILPVITVL
jgi:ribonuclease J